MFYDLKCWLSVQFYGFTDSIGRFEHENCVLGILYFQNANGKVSRLDLMCWVSVKPNDSKDSIGRSSIETCVFLKFFIFSNPQYQGSTTQCVDINALSARTWILLNSQNANDRGPRISLLIFGIWGLVFRIQPKA